MKVSATQRENPRDSHRIPKVFTKAWANHVWNKLPEAGESHLKRIAGTVFSIQMGLILTAVSVPIT